MSSTRLLAVVCTNGVGHFRRALEVLRCLSQLEPSMALHVVCDRWQRERMRDWPVLTQLQARTQLRWHDDILGPSVGWSHSAADYADGRLRSWIERLRTVEHEVRPDLVLSDNLAGVLAIRHDTVLMGSFLWSDVLNDAYSSDPQVADFVAWERALLSAHRPFMLCVDALATAGVTQRTRAIRLPWMRTKTGRPELTAARPSASVPRVAVLIGATGAAEEVAVAITEALIARHAEVALPPELFPRFRGKPGASLFGFDSAGFLSCDAALCRPGLGSLHDCVFHGVPMVLLQEPQNAELRHNIERIEALGFGMRLEASVPAAAAEQILAFAGSELASAARRRMAREEFGGVEQAAEWLLGTLRKRQEEAEPARDQPTTLTIGI